MNIQFRSVPFRRFFFFEFLRVVRISRVLVVELPMESEFYTQSTLNFLTSLAEQITQFLWTEPQKNFHSNLIRNFKSHSVHFYGCISMSPFKCSSIPFFMSQKNFLRLHCDKILYQLFVYPYMCFTHFCVGMKTCLAWQLLNKHMIVLNKWIQGYDKVKLSLFNKVLDVLYFFGGINAED